MALLEDYLEQEAELKRSFKAVAAYSMVASLCMLAMPIFLMQVYTRVLMSRSMETLVALGIFAIVIIFAYGYFETVRMALLSKTAARFESKMSGLVLAGELARQTDSTAQTLRDIGSLRQTIASPVFAALFELPVAPLFFLIILLIHPVLGLVVMLGGGALVGIAIWGSRRTDPLTNAQMDALIKTHRSLDGHMSSQEIIRAQGMYREAVRDWGQYQGTQLDLFVKNFSLMSAFASASKAGRQLVQILIIGAGAILVLMDAATAGVIFAASIIGGRALFPIEQVVGGWRNLKQAHETRKRLMLRLEDLTLPEKRTKLPEVKGIIQFERVVYSPRPGVPPIIKGVSGGIAAGDRVAIVGPSGAGKSTLARLTVGYLQPSSGRILLDGQDLNTWDPVTRGLNVGYVPQHVNFFEATVRENIARLRRDDPPELAIEAAKFAGVHEMIMRLPQGYDTFISKQAFYPSGGQAQLIALARAFYGMPALLVLDEPNAALDNIGEQIFHNALRAAHQAKMTVLVVTQRTSVLNFVDKVMMMQDGAIKKFGTKEEVLNSGHVQAVPKKTAPAQQKQASPPKVAAKGAAASRKASGDGEKS